MRLQCLGEGVQVALFGSRLHDDQKGGGVDLYTETSAPRLMQKMRCKVRLQDQLDLPVDLIVKPTGDKSRVSQVAKKEGVVL